MTRLASVALILASTTRAEEPKPIPTELEGAWREPLKPGEKAADKLTVTFSNDQITLVWAEAVYRGPISPDPERDLDLFRFTITLTDETGKHPERTYIGLCIKMRNQVFLQVEPYPVGSGRGQDWGQRLLPMTFTLEKLKK